MSIVLESKVKEEHKQQIVAMMVQKSQELGLSDASAAKQIGISGGYYSQIKNGQWQHIAESTWNKVAAWVNLRISGWQAAQTRTFKRIYSICQHAMKDSIALAICDEPGSGKSFALKHYAEHTRNVYYVEAQEYFTKSVFIQEIAISLGIKVSGSIAEQVNSIIETLQKRKGALLIIDEMDKLKDGCLNIWKTLYNILEGLCGFIICGAPSLKKRLMNGAKKDKQCYKEIISRIGSEFIPVLPLNKEDIKEVCISNGVTGEGIQKVFKEYEGNDLRVLKRVIERIKLELGI